MLLVGVFGVCRGVLRYWLVHICIHLIMGLFVVFVGRFFELMFVWGELVSFLGEGVFLFVGILVVCSFKNGCVVVAGGVLRCSWFGVLFCVCFVVVWFVVCVLLFVHVLLFFPRR